VGFLTSRPAPQGGEAKRAARRILRLAPPVVVGPPEERFDRVGADRQADGIEPKRLGDVKLERKIGAKLAAQSG
jgi:hypothetical protein